MKLKTFISDPPHDHPHTLSVHGSQALEELLPGIDDFIINTLSKESLSSLAERKRQYYVERLEFLQQPPSLPPRPPGLPKLTDSPQLRTPRRPSKEPEQDSNVQNPPPPPERPRKSLLPRPTTYDPATQLEMQNGLRGGGAVDSTQDDDFAAKQRQIARDTSTETFAPAPPPLLPRNSRPPPPVPEPMDDSDHYSDIDYKEDMQSDGLSIDDDNYEVPTNIAETPSGSLDLLVGNTRPKKPDTDSNSGTSYESYDEQESRDVIDDDSGVSSTKREDTPEAPAAEKRKSRSDIPLPRIKSKRKKKKSGKEGHENEPALPPSSTVTAIKNVMCRGNLYQKRKLMWVRRYCVLADKALLIYNSERDTRALSNIPLDGTDVLYLDKEGRRCHVVRLAQPGQETHWFSAETKEETEIWFEHLLNAAGLSTDDAAESESRSISSADKILGSDQHPPLVPTVSNEQKEKGSTSTLSHGSEEGSTSTDQLPISPNFTQGDTSPKNKKGISDKLSSFFSIGKKKGKRATQVISTDVEPVEGSLYSPVTFEGVTPSISIAGRFKVMRDPESEEWEEMYCQVKNGLFEVYEHHTDSKDVLTFPLFGCEVLEAPEVKRDLAIKIAQGGNQKLVFEPSDPLEQGNWLNILIRATNKSSAPPPEDSNRDNQPSADTEAPVAIPKMDSPVVDSRDQFISTSSDSLGYSHIYEESATLTESFLKALEDGVAFSTAVEPSSGTENNVEMEVSKDEEPVPEKTEATTEGNFAVPQVRIEREYDLPAEDSSTDEDSELKTTGEHVYDSVSMHSTSDSVAASDKESKQQKSDKERDSGVDAQSDEHLWHDDHDIYESCFENQLETDSTEPDKESPPAVSVIQQEKEMLEKSPNPVLVKIRAEKQQRRMSGSSVSSTESVTSPVHSTPKPLGTKVEDMKKRFQEISETRMNASESKLHRKVSSLDKSGKLADGEGENKLNKSVSESQLSRLAIARLSYQEKRKSDTSLRRRSFQKTPVEGIDSETKSLDQHLDANNGGGGDGENQRLTARSSTVSSSCSSRSEATNISSSTKHSSNSKDDDTKRSNTSLNSVEKANMYAMPDKMTKRHNKTGMAGMVKMPDPAGDSADVYEDSAIVPPPKRGILGALGDSRMSKKKQQKENGKPAKSVKEGKRLSRFHRHLSKDEEATVREVKEQEKSHSSKESLLDEVKLRKHSKTSQEGEDEEIANDPEVKRLRARIDELKASILETKQQRSAIKEERSLARQHSEKKAFDEELRYLDNQHKNLERELDEEEHELSCVIRLKHSSLGNMNRSGIRKSMREVKSRVQERLKRYKTRRVTLVQD